MNVKGRAVPSSWYAKISHAGSAGDAALDWGGRALCAESERVSALMSASAPRSLSLCESGLPSQGSGRAASLVPRPGLHEHLDGASSSQDA
jgi:hypothetical protein